MHKGHLVKFLGLTVLAAIGVMAVSASTAQAKWLLLLNGVSVLLLNLLLETLKSYIKAENGLKIECQSGHGIGHLQLSMDHKTLTGELENGAFQGCVWVGSEKTCTINDGGVGVIKAHLGGEAVMPDANTYILGAESEEFATTITEGVFCTIPEEEVVSGKLHLLVLNALEDQKIKLGQLLPLNVKLGNSKVTQLVDEVHIKDADNANATIGFHLVNL